MPLRDRRVIVTGGPTREWIDPVRYISNASSGKMGIALADAACDRGCETLFIHGPIDVSLLAGKNYRTVGIESTAELLDAVIGEMTGGCVLIMAAAPADYRPADRSPEKIKKTGTDLVIRLRKNPDILKRVAEERSAGRLKGIFVAGFAAETTDAERYAIGKLEDKELDMICLNDVSAESAGFGKDTNIITIFKKDGSRTDLPVMPKRDAAERILDAIDESLQA